MHLLRMIDLWGDIFWLYLIVALILSAALNWQTRSLKKFPLIDRIHYLELEANDEQHPTTFQSRESLAVLLFVIFMLLSASGVLIPFFIIFGHALPKNLLWLIVPLIIDAVLLWLILGLARHYAKPTVTREQQRHQALLLTTQRLFAWRKYFGQYIQFGWLILAELAINGWLLLLIQVYLRRR